MLEYRRYRDAAAHLAELHADGRRYLYRSARLPPELRRASLDAATKSYEPALLAEAIGDLLRTPPEPDTSHIRPTVSLEKRLRVLRRLLGRRRGLVLREVAGGFALAAHPDAEDAARRLLARPRTPPLTRAQAETLAIIAYLQPVSRPEIARIRGVASESAVATLTERGLIEEAGRSRFGAVVYRSTPLFERLFGLAGLDQLPDPSSFDPAPEDERELRERLLKAGEQRAS